MAGSLILVANPGSASRKYGLYDGDKLLADLHFENYQGRIICTFTGSAGKRRLEVKFSRLNQAASQIAELFKTQAALPGEATIDRIGLRIVAPGGYFLEDRLITSEVLEHLHQINRQAPVHIEAMLDELEQLLKQFPSTPVIGVSDSRFHATKPDHAWNYGLPLEDADRLDIKRFGYHGLSVESVISQLKASGKLPKKLLVVHLGSGASVTAVLNGQSIDNTMGYSPLEGLIMATRSGSIDTAATQVLKHAFNYDDAQLSVYLNRHSGILGLGGNSDIRELLRREDTGDERAKLALNTYIYNIQKAIGQMAAALGGIDGLVFTGTIGERSAAIRARVMNQLGYLGVLIDEQKNLACTEATELVNLTNKTTKKLVYVVPAHENSQIACRALGYNL